MSPGPIFEPEGEGKDWYGTARALYAAGFRPGDIVHNSFAYHLTPGGFILESGCRALGCAVIPGGVGNTEQQLEAIAHYRPSGYVGTPDFLKILLDTAKTSGKDASSMKRALVSGAALPASLRDELKARGVAVLQCYATAELGVIAYESEAREGMIVNETVIVEIVRPGTGDPRRGRRGRRGGGDVVQSRLSDDPARHRRPVRTDARRFALWAHQWAHQRLDGAGRPDGESERHVRASQADRRGRRAASAACAVAPGGRP